jgi:hypothetical protein
VSLVMKVICGVDEGAAVPVLRRITDAQSIPWYCISTTMRLRRSDDRKTPQVRLVISNLGTVDFRDREGDVNQSLSGFRDQTVAPGVLIEPLADRDLPWFMPRTNLNEPCKAAVVVDHRVREKVRLSTGPPPVRAAAAEPLQ